MAWLTVFAFLVVASLLFVVTNNQSVAQSFALMMRLFLQLGYQLTLRRREEAIQCCREISRHTIFLIFFSKSFRTSVCRETKQPNKNPVKLTEREFFQSLSGAAAGLRRLPQPHIHLLLLRSHRKDDLGPGKDQHQLFRRRERAG